MMRTPAMMPGTWLAVSGASPAGDALVAPKFRTGETELFVVEHLHHQTTIDGSRAPWVKR